MVDFLLIFMVPAVGGWLACRLWHTRPRRAAHCGTAVGQVPLRFPHHLQAVRRETVL